MVLTSDKQRIKTLLTETVMLLCKNGLHFKSEFCIEGLIGITLDQDEVFLVSIKETVRTESNEANSSRETTISTSRLSTGASASSADERARSSAAVKIAKAKVEVPEATFPDSDTCEFAPEVEEREGPRRAVQGTARKRHISSNVGRLSDSAIGGNSSAASARQFDNSVTLDMDVRSGETAASVRKSKTVNDSSESEPIQKRLRTPSSARSEDFSGADDSRSRTTEPSRLTPEQDYIEIKEESLSDNEFDSSVNSQGSFVAGAGGYGSSSFGHGNAGAYGEVNPGCSTWAPGQAAGDVYGGDQQQQQQQQQVELVPGSGVYVRLSLLQQLEDEQRGSRMVRRLIHEMFPDERLLAASCCRGKRLPGGFAQAGLDPQVIDAIKVYVGVRRPAFAPADIVQTINYMCVEARKKVRRYAEKLATIFPVADGR